MINVRRAEPWQEFINAFKKHERDFYFKQANLVVEILSSERVQTFLRQIIKKEEIEENLISDIRVMVFPSKIDREDACTTEKSRVSYHKGRFNKRTRQISIYPPIMLGSKEDRDPETLICALCPKEGDLKEFYRLPLIPVLSVMSLIHEILHCKYSGEGEEKVRGLTLHYARLFFQDFKRL